MGNTITLGEFKELLKYLIQNNGIRYNNNESPIAIGIEGPAGIGKTESIKQVAEELGYGYIRLNLSELEEVSDLTGFPIKEYETKDGRGISADIIKYCKDLDFTGNVRTNYAPPSGLPPESGGEKPGGILALDDYTRANSLFMQATMELIQNGKYISGNLPKNTNIVLSSNPDDGQFSVTSLDPAQQSRFINFPVKFNIDDFAQGTERNNIDNRA